MYSYWDILASEVIEEGGTVTRTQRSSQIAGTLIGGLALGGVGAIIGGLSGTTKTTKNDMVTPLLRVIVNDISRWHKSTCENRATESERPNVFRHMGQEIQQ